MKKDHQQSYFASFVYGKPLPRFLLWSLIGFLIVFLGLYGYDVVTAKRNPDPSKFDPDVYPMIFVIHVPPVIAKTSENLKLEFSFACGYVSGEREDCNPDATLYVAWGQDQNYSPLALNEEDHNTLRVLTASVPATDDKGKMLRYFLMVTDVTADVKVRYPTQGEIEPTVYDKFISVELPSPNEEEVGDILLEVPWGTGPNEVGLSAEDDQLTVGPDSFDVSPDGNVRCLITLINVC